MRCSRGSREPPTRRHFGNSQRWGRRWRCNCIVTASSLACSAYLTDVCHTLAFPTPAPNVSSPPRQRGRRWWHSPAPGHSCLGGNIVDSTSPRVGVCFLFSTFSRGHKAGVWGRSVMESVRVWALFRLIRPQLTYVDFVPVSALMQQPCVFLFFPHAGPHATLMRRSRMSAGGALFPWLASAAGARPAPVRSTLLAVTAPPRAVLAPATINGSGSGSSSSSEEQTAAKPSTWIFGGSEPPPPPMPAVSYRHIEPPPPHQVTPPPSPASSPPLPPSPPHSVVAGRDFAETSARQRPRTASCVRSTSSVGGGDASTTRPEVGSTDEMFAVGGISSGCGDKWFGPASTADLGALDEGGDVVVVAGAPDNAEGPTVRAGADGWQHRGRSASPTEGDPSGRSVSPTGGRLRARASVTATAKSAALRNETKIEIGMPTEAPEEGGSAGNMARAEWPYHGVAAVAASSDKRSRWREDDDGASIEAAGAAVEQALPATSLQTPPPTRFASTASPGGCGGGYTGAPVAASRSSVGCRLRARRGRERQCCNALA